MKTSPQQEIAVVAAKLSWMAQNASLSSEDSMTLWQMVRQLQVVQLYLSSTPVATTEAPSGVQEVRRQEGGDHYLKHKIQPWDVIDEYNLNFYEGNALKYLLRHKDKNGLEDLYKLRHYIDKLILQEEDNVANRKATEKRTSGALDPSGAPQRTGS